MNKIAACLVCGLLIIAAGAAQAQISDDRVKIGVLTDMSSLYADGTGKGSFVAAQMAAADFGGTVRGKPIEIIAADHQNKADIGASIARNWYDNEKVDMIIDLPNSSVAFAVQTITKDKNKLVIISGGGSSDLTGKACTTSLIHWTYDTYALSNVAGKAMVARGDDTWFFLTADYAFAKRSRRTLPRS
jgi:branched-chain amino acid transport system substrate-binding protein